MCTLQKPPAGRALSEGKEAPQAAFPSWRLVWAGKHQLGNAACSFPGAKARSWAGRGEARPGQSSLSAGALCYRAWAQSFVKEKFPQLIKCMSTNGLLLSERAQDVIDIGIDSLTVTVNAVDPEIENKLNAYIIYHGQKIEGVEGAKILIENQLAGIRKVAAAGITVKVNTVLVPEINGDHIEQIAKTV